MIKKAFILLLLLFVVGLSACNGDTALSSGSLAPPAEASSQEASVTEPSVSQRETRSPEGTTAPVPDKARAENESGDWAGLAGWRKKALEEGNADLITVSSTTDTVELDGVIIKRDESPAVPNEEGLPASFVGFITKYNNSTLRVRPVLTEDGGPYFPDNTALENTVLGETVFETSGISGAYGLTIPYLNEPDAEHPGESKTGCRYAVTFEWDGGEAVYYFAGPYYSILQLSSNIKKYYMPDAPEDGGEAESSPEQEAPTAPPAGEAEPLSRYVSLPDAKAAPTLLNEAEQEAFTASIDAEEIKRIAKEKQIGLRGDSWEELTVESVKRLDGVGSLAAVNNGKRGIARAVVLYGPDNRLIDVTTNYETFNEEQRQGIWPIGDGSGWLVGSDKSLFFISANKGVPQLIRQTRWMSLEIKDPADPAASLYFGATFLAYSYAGGRPQADSDLFFAVRRGGNDLTALLTTKAIVSETAYVFQDLMRDVIATPEQEFSPAQPYEASFDRQSSLVRVRFPTSGSVLDFDFNRASIAYHTNYTEELLEQDESKMLDSTYDGRFQLWQVNVRHGFESIWASHVVYDTLSGSIQDFGAVGQYIHPTFMDDRTVAVYSYEASATELPQDDPGYGEARKASIRQGRQRIVLYDLLTGEQREPKLDLSEFGWSERIHGYVWDADTRRQIVLSTSLYQNPALPFEGEEDPYAWSSQYHISYFSEEGALQRITRTGVSRFQGRFEYFLPGFRSLGGGRATLYQTGSERSGLEVQSYAFDPETGELTDYFNADREKQMISYEVQQWAQNGKPGSVSRVVSNYVDYWAKQPEGAGVFAHFVEQLQQTPCWVTDYYSPETGILVADDIYDLKFYWLSADGQSIGTDMVTAEQAVWRNISKPLYVQDARRSWYGVYLAGERLSIYRWDDTEKLLHDIPMELLSPLLPRSVSFTIREADYTVAEIHLGKELYPHTGLRWENGEITIYNEKKPLLRVYIEADSIRCVVV